MTFIFQLCIILLISLVGEALHALIPLPVPASIYGLALMLVCLKTKLIRIERANKAGAFLLEIMPLLFIPAAVGLLTAWDALQSILLPIIVLIFVVTVIVMAVTGRMAQWMLRKDEEK